MPNDDLISREAAKEIVSLMVCAPSIKIAAEHKIDEIPSIDAASVKHGRWIDECCSLCGQYVYRGDARNYCPRCGAKNDGGDGDD